MNFKQNKPFGCTKGVHSIKLNSQYKVQVKEKVRKLLKIKISDLCKAYEKAIFYKDRIITDSFMSFF